jgi:hypothetical protein
MKKVIIAVLVLITLTLYGCSVTTNNLTTTNDGYDTNVKMIGLEYDNLSDVSTNKDNLVVTDLTYTSPDKIQKIDYIFPEETLIFTIIIEDPNYEFISLQSIVFNNETIRGNTDDAITETRDCGENICIDFPHIVKADIINYTVTQVKFTKANSETGFAIINEDSLNTVTIEIYTNSIYPYVHESVNLLNTWIENMNYYNDNYVFTNSEWEALWEDFFVTRTLKILNFEDSINYATDDILNPDNTDVWMYAGATYGIMGMLELTTSTKIFMHNGQSVSFAGPTLSNYYFEERYSDIYFYNIDNSIYANILGYEIFVIEMGKRTRFAYLEEADYQLYQQE